MINSMRLQAEDILRVCMSCTRVAAYGTEDWREAMAPDKVHPAQSHGYCSEACMFKQYPSLMNHAHSQR